MARVRNRLRQPLLINLGKRRLHIGPRSTVDISDTERDEAHLKRMETAGHVEVIPDIKVPAGTKRTTKEKGKKKKKTKGKKRRKKKINETTGG